MSDEQSMEDLSDELIDVTIATMDEKTAKAMLRVVAQQCVCAVAGYEKKYYLVYVLKTLFGNEKFGELAKNQQQLYGEPWDRWAE